MPIIKSGKAPISRSPSPAANASQASSISTGSATLLSPRASSSNAEQTNQETSKTLAAYQATKAPSSLENKKAKIKESIDHLIDQLSSYYTLKNIGSYIIFLMNKEENETWLKKLYLAIPPLSGQNLTRRKTEALLFFFPEGKDTSNYKFLIETFAKAEIQTIDQIETFYAFLKETHKTLNQRLAFPRKIQSKSIIAFAGAMFKFLDTDENRNEYQGNFIKIFFPVYYQGDNAVQAFTSLIPKNTNIYLISEIIRELDRANLLHLLPGSLQDFASLFPKNTKGENILCTAHAINHLHLSLNNNEQMTLLKQIFPNGAIASQNISYALAKIKLLSPQQYNKLINIAPEYIRNSLNQETTEIITTLKEAGIVTSEQIKALRAIIPFTANISNCRLIIEVLNKAKITSAAQLQALKELFPDDANKDDRKEIIDALAKKEITSAAQLQALKELFPDDANKDDRASIIAAVGKAKITNPEQIQVLKRLFPNGTNTSYRIKIIAAVGKAKITSAAQLQALKGIFPDDTNKDDRANIIAAFGKAKITNPAQIQALKGIFLDDTNKDGRASIIAAVGKAKITNPEQIQALTKLIANSKNRGAYYYIDIITALAENNFTDSKQLKNLAILFPNGIPRYQNMFCTFIKHSLLKASTQYEAQYRALTELLPENTLNTIRKITEDNPEIKNPELLQALSAIIPRNAGLYNIQQIIVTLKENDYMEIKSIQALGKILSELFTHPVKSCRLNCSDLLKFIEGFSEAKIPITDPTYENATWRSLIAGNELTEDQTVTIREKFISQYSRRPDTENPLLMKIMFL